MSRPVCDVCGQPDCLGLTGLTLRNTCRNYPRTTSRVGRVRSETYSASPQRGQGAARKCRSEADRQTKRLETNDGQNSLRDCSITQPLITVEKATESWRQSVRGWYPNLHTKTYFLPPLHFNRVPYDVQSIANQNVRVPTKPDHVTISSFPSDPSTQPQPRHVASSVWSDVPSETPPRVQETDVSDDRAIQQVLGSIRELAEERQEVMMVLSQLDYRKYLDNHVDPITAAATRLLSIPASQGYSYGEFDVLIISRLHGLIVAEVKSVGADPKYSTDQAVAKRVEKAVKQLNKADVVLRPLVSDLAPVKVTKVLMLPNITSTQLQQALATNPQVEQDLCKCVGAPDTTAAVARCLCADTIQNKSSVWWERAVTDHGHDTNMTDDIYETLVARFCGPATTVEVPTVTTARCPVQLRTLGDAIAHTGLLMSLLTLYPEQVDLLNRPQLPLLFLWGPPGTGKTVVLALKGLQWRNRGKDVHLLSLNKDSRGVVMLMESQLKHSLATSATSRVRRHVYDFESKEDVDRAVNDLKIYAVNGELYVIVDEAFSACSDSAQGNFAEFVRRLFDKVPKLHLWAASVRHNTIPTCLKQERLTTPVRCPPAVCRQVAQSTILDDRLVPKYSSSVIPSPTDGPAVRWLHHSARHGSAASLPGNCDRCGSELADLILELLKCQSGHDLQYRDTIILVPDPRDSLPVVRCLREQRVPVNLVKPSDSIHAIRELALAETDFVTVTHHSVVAGLERRVVVVMEQNDNTSRLYAMSRSTSLLVLYD